MIPYFGRVCQTERGRELEIVCGILQRKYKTLKKVGGGNLTSGGKGCIIEYGKVCTMHFSKGNDVWI